MADLAVVSLGIDATGMKTGADQANRALTGVEKKMDDAQKKIDELQKKVDESGKNVAAAGKSFEGFGTAVSKGAGALSALGGPIGQAAGAFQQLQGQIGGLLESFGLIGGAAIAAVAGVAALGGALVKMTLDGVKLSDEMGDIAEATGLTLEQVQRLQAAFAAAGEGIGGMERAFAAFEQLVQSAKEGSNEASKTLNSLKVNAQDASKDIGTAFSNLIVNLKNLTGTIDGSTAAHTAFSRQTGALIRVSDEYRKVMEQSTETLVKFNKIAGTDAVAAGQRLDSEMNRLTQSFNIFKQNLAATSIGKGLENYFHNLNVSLTNTRTNTDLLTLAWKNLSVAGQLVQIFKGPDIDLSTGPKRSLGVQDAAPFKPNPIKPTGTKSEKPVDLITSLAELDKANAKAKAFFDAFRNIAEASFAVQLLNLKEFTDEMERIDTGFHEAQLQNAKQAQAELTSQLATLKPGTENFKRVSEELGKVTEQAIALAKQLGIGTLPQIEKLNERLKDLQLPLVALPSSAGGFTRPRTVGTHPDDVGFPETRARKVRTAEQEKLDEQFAQIFDGFLFSIFTAQQTVGGAFKDLALGIADTFAQELAVSFRQAFITPLIKQLTDWLSEGISSIFSGISGKSAGKFFAGAAKFFAGLFAEGGTIPAGQFGIVGERGPELAFAGSQSLQIAPARAGGGGGGNTFQINVGVNAPQGTVDRRTQDQIAATVLAAVRRASRNEGAR